MICSKLSENANWISPKCSAIPEELKSERRFLLWKFEDRGCRKPTKIPKQVSGQNARVNDRETWCSYDEAVQAYENGDFDGIGFVLGWGIVGVDLDNCRDPETGELNDFAKLVIERLDSYTEVSPSGTGVKILVYAGLTEVTRSIRTAQIEVYDRLRYFTLTGVSLGDSRGLQRRQDELKWVLDLPQSSVNQAVNQTDVDEARQLLTQLSDDRADDYHDWILVGMALKSVGDDRLLEDYVNFSQRSSKYRPGEPEQKWQSFKGDGISLGTLHHYAKLDQPVVASGKKAGIKSHPKGSNVDPSTLASEYLETAVHMGSSTLVCWQEACYRWTDGVYTPITWPFLQSDVVRQLAARYSHITTAVTKNVMMHIRSQTSVDNGTVPGTWLRGSNRSLDRRNTLVTKQGIVQLDQLWAGQDYKLSSTPDFFNTSCLQAEFDPEASPPKRWLSFLDEIFGGDKESIEVVQQWMGLMLVPDTRFQKIFFMIGPPRSGKGTICNVIREILGNENVAAPSLSSLSANFGLAPLVGKSVAIVSDARLGGRSDQQALVERMLSISGEDVQTIDRKNLPHLTTQLTARLMVVTNELPRLNEASGALVNRLVLVKTKKSFVGKEDTGLESQLKSESSGILKWAIDGLRQLRVSGRFVVPSRSNEMLKTFCDLSSPVQAFIDERCQVCPGCTVSKQELYLAYQAWCELNGQKVMNKQTFGATLLAAYPELSSTRPRNDSRQRPYYWGGVAIVSP